MGRERVTITIRDDILRQVDRMVDGLTLRSRSQAIEFLLSRFLADYRVNAALILAGGPGKAAGKGSRFALALNGRPLIQHVMDYLNGFNVSNFFVWIDDANKEVEQVLTQQRLPYHVEFLRGGKSRGNIEPLMRARGLFKDTFLVAYGDSLVSLNINDMLSFHRQHKGLATLSLTTVSNPRDYGVAMLQGERISDFIQKPRGDVESYLVNAGYFLFEPEIFKYLSKDMRTLEKDFFPGLAAKNLLLGYPFQGRYVNVHSAADAERAKVME